jgi:hypothetical protein
MPMNEETLKEGVEPIENLTRNSRELLRSQSQLWVVVDEVRFNKELMLKPGS